MEIRIENIKRQSNRKTRVKRLREVKLTWLGREQRKRRGVMRALKLIRWRHVFVTKRLRCVLVKGSGKYLQKKEEWYKEPK